jgi:imidazolonepropionase-like amidohydrolase
MGPRPREFRNLLVCAVAVIGSGCGSPEGEKPLVLTGATVINGMGQSTTNAVVVVDGRTIIDVGPSGGVEIPKNAEVIDMTGRWIIPGLIDAHVRTEAWALPRFLAYGVTTVRDLGSETNAILELANASDLNTVLGPRIYATGSPVGGLQGEDVTSSSSARQAVDKRSVAGVAYILADYRISPTLLRAIADESQSFELSLIGQLGLTDAVTATEIGVFSIERLSGIPQAAAGSASKIYSAYRQGYQQGWIEAERAWSRLRAGSLDRVAETLATAGTVVTPTLIWHEVMANLDDPSMLEQPEPGALPLGSASPLGPAVMREHGLSAADLRAFRQGRPVQDRFVMAFRSHGGKVAVGTGATAPFLLPGASLHRELQLLVRAGFSPMEALTAATSGNAATLGADSLGALAPGMAADLVILTADPLQDIRNTRAIENVMIRGQLLLVETIKLQW